MNRDCVRLAVILVIGMACSAWAAAPQVVKRLIRVDDAAANLLVEKNWQASGKGFVREAEALVCDNGGDASVIRGASQTIVLNQERPLPVVATAWSKAENVSGPRNADYSLYLDIEYADGGHLWGRTGQFDAGTHDWQRQEVRVLPEKPIKRISVHLLLRRHSGKAWFRAPGLQQIDMPRGAAVFDGLIVQDGGPFAGIAVRDAAADSDFLQLMAAGAMGLTVKDSQQRQDDFILHDIEIADTTGKDRAITVAACFPVGTGEVRYLADPRREEAVQHPREYRSLDHSGRISRWPLAAVAVGGQGKAIGIDMALPAVFRAGYASSGELYIVWDIALTPEKPSARLRFFTLHFDAAWGFRGAVAALYQHFPEQFRNPFAKQGLWMPFHTISKVEGWEDFGFAFKEGNDETAWDDAHGIVTFRYTEPMTWWMRMPKDTPRTLEAAVAHAKALAAKGDKSAQALFTSGHRDQNGNLVASMRNEPWCDGAVWSMNSMPGIAGEATDFRNKWNPALREKLYGAGRKGDLDGEYVDSIEGWVTDELDYAREHFAAAQTPLTFDPLSHRPAIHKGLISFEYTRAIRDDLRAIGKHTMANGAGSRFCWLVPLLDLNGTETDWHRNGQWRPTGDEELIRVRALCGVKPYCFLMNTRFEGFPPALVEKYMKRSLAYGMFPGFFSHNASEGHYFSRPELYNRDRPLFKKYIPLCRLVAEAGWQPIPLARTDDLLVRVERWGQKHLTVFNDSGQTRTIALRLDGLSATTATERVTGRPIAFTNNAARITLEGEDVAVLELR